MDASVVKKQNIKITANNSYFSDFVFNQSLGEVLVVTAITPVSFSQFDEGSVELSAVIDNLKRLGVEHQLVEA